LTEFQHENAVECGSGLAREDVSPNDSQPLNCHSACRPSRPWLPFQPWAAFLAAISAVHQAAFGLATLAGLARCASQTSGTAIHPHLDLLRREVLRQLDPHLRTRRALNRRTEIQINR
jgi:hypothetical protein